ncbi:hypothetical protein VTK26DRAFT_5178 [Humicola hyalothermophila]
MGALGSLFQSGARYGSRYTPLPTSASSLGQQQAHVPSPKGRILRCTAAGLMLAMVGYLVVTLLNSGPQQCDTPEHGFQCNPEISHSWGQYSPYFSVPSEIDDSIPEGCEPTLVQILSRHGARAPTFNRAVEYIDVIQRIQGSVTEYGSGYEFLKTYNYTLGADQLTPMGEQQMVNSGLKFYQRYRSLARKSVPFVRAAGQDRVIHSALNWTRGYRDALVRDRTSTAPPDAFPPADMVIIPETPGSNNTLHHGLCRAFEEGPYSTIGHSAQSTWRAVFAPPITARLNANLPGANLTDADTVSLMDLCPFSTVASPPRSLSRPLSPSPFCALFPDPAEWRAYAHYQALGKFYGYGPGNPLGPTQGVGFVNELLARLTRALPVRDGTSSNATLDADPRTFPVDRAVYADFGHDNDMVAALSALRAYDGVGMLSNETCEGQGPRENGGFSAAWAVPFAGRVYVELMRCGQAEELVRVLVNDRVIRLEGCGADELGRCTLGRFVESMKFAREGGRWDWCFE